MSDEPSVAIMEALPAEVLHFINDLEDEIDRLQFRVRVLGVLGDKEVVASDVVYWKDRTEAAEKVAVELAHDVMTTADSAWEYRSEFPHQQRKYGRDTETARAALAAWDE